MHLLWIVALLLVPIAGFAHAQDTSSHESEGSGSISVERDDAIVITTLRRPPEPRVLYTVHARATANLRPDRMEQSLSIDVKIVQGDAKTITIAIIGDDQVTNVEADAVTAWSVRQQGAKRFLDLQLKEKVTEFEATISTRSPDFDLPSTRALTHLAPGEAIGFQSIVELVYAAGVEGEVTTSEGFLKFSEQAGVQRFQTTQGGELKIALRPDATAPTDVELNDTQLIGTLDETGRSMTFRYESTATVRQAPAELTILSGAAALPELPTDEHYRLRLTYVDGHPVYRMEFLQTGDYRVAFEFVAAVTPAAGNGHALDFTVGSSAVVPVILGGLEEDLQFQQDTESVVPLPVDGKWRGYLPATGRAKMSWKAERKAADGKTFFATQARVEAKVSAGLLRQDHEVRYQVLQGSLNAIQMEISGPGEILDVKGANLIAWQIEQAGDARTLKITLSQPVTGTADFLIRSQTALGAFPVSMEGMRLTPTDAIRHSGYLRLSNLGSVRVEPTDIEGLTQLAPEQYPADALPARQVFAYRFPSAAYQFTVAADRVQPEVNASQLVLYELGETDRVINADIELDVREAPIREWELRIPADYSVVSVTAAALADYVVGTNEVDGLRNLRVVFGQAVSGRVLVTLQLQKNEAAAAGSWALPRIEFPGVESLRGDIGVVGAPGYRLTYAEADVENLLEKPLSYFPRQTPHLQQAFRVQQADWAATMSIEKLERAVQADVFHLYSLSQETVYGSVLLNYFVTGAPVSQWRINVPPSLGNVMVEGKDVRTWRQEEDTLIVSLHQPVMGAYTLLVTFEEKPKESDNSFTAGLVTPVGVQGERGYVQVVSPHQIEITTSSEQDVLPLDPLELPAEFRLLSSAPALGTWQYTERNLEDPFQLRLQVNWFEPGTTVSQVVDFAEATSRLSQDGEVVTELVYYVKSRGQQTLRLKLPDEPVRLWEASVNGVAVTARQSEDTTLIPLPGNVDLNSPVEVRLRLGKPSVRAARPQLALPIVYAPVLKTQWKVRGDKERVLVPSGGTVSPPTPVLRPTGFHWVSRRGILPLVAIAVLVGLGYWATRATAWLRVVGLVALLMAVLLSFTTASQAARQVGRSQPIELNLPVSAPGEAFELTVNNWPVWRASVSIAGVVVSLLALACIVYSYLGGAQLGESSEPSAAPHEDGGERSAIDGGTSLEAESTATIESAPGTSLPAVEPLDPYWLRVGGVLLLCVGGLMQRASAPAFFGILGVAILLFLIAKPAWQTVCDLGDAMQRWGARRQLKKQSAAESGLSSGESDSGPETAGGAATVTLLLLGLGLAFAPRPAQAEVPTGFQVASRVSEDWELGKNAALQVSAKLTVAGKPGDRFVLLKSPAVLTDFKGPQLRLTKTTLEGWGQVYIVSVPTSTETSGEGDFDATESEGQQPLPVERYEATFSYRVESVDRLQGVPVLTGAAASHAIEVAYEEPGWEVTCPAAVRIEPQRNDQATQAKLLLGPGEAKVVFRPQERDVSTETTQFFVETANLYVARPGVVDGRHRIQVRLSQGQVRQMRLLIPGELTVSAVNGPVASWQFDAEEGRLDLELDAPQSEMFELSIETQRSLAQLPTSATLSPVRVDQANGEVGLIAVAFGSDAQPEKVSSETLSTVNVGDFDATLLQGVDAVVHRVYRYGRDDASLSVNIVPVQPEIRVATKQVLSRGDERIVLAVNLAVEISRAGVFQLSFDLPDGFEVESLSGPALHHWSELPEQRQIVLHLKEKTLGSQSFALTMTSLVPTEVSGEWEVPRFVLNESSRQTGELVVRPTTGLRLLTVRRQNVSEVDPASIGGRGQGALAFRLLQRDWSLLLTVDQQEAWRKGEVLHEVTLREGQTTTSIRGKFEIRNAGIRQLQVKLPVTEEEEKTLRVTGEVISDLTRRAPGSDIWELKFKRSVVGDVEFQIEFERRGERPNQTETVAPVLFPEAQQLSYHLAVRTGGRLELTHEELPGNWQQGDWNLVSHSLREGEKQHAAPIVLRANAPDQPIVVQVKRHSLAEALKLRVAEGRLTTVLSPDGNQLTAVDLQMEVIQRSSLSFGLPADGKVFSVFVNGESVNSVRVGPNGNTWRFYVLPGIDDRTATVRVVYSLPGRRISKLRLRSPQLNVPLENIQWNVVAPEGYELLDHDGTLELKNEDVDLRGKYDRKSYLSKLKGQREVQAQQAVQMLEQANQLLQVGEQAKALRAFSNVANQFALDAASNEDARVQLENLQTQQAIVGLNTRRQRLYLSNRPDADFDNEQLRAAAADNPVLQQDQLKFRPQELSQLLRGNTSEDNAVLQRIAGRLVQHQRTTEPAPKAININLPSEGALYTFERSVQVAEQAPLELDLVFGLEHRTALGPSAAVLGGLALLAVVLSRAATGLRYGRPGRTSVPEAQR